MIDDTSENAEVHVESHLKGRAEEHPPAQLVVSERAVSQAVHAAVSALYFDDSSDFKSSLWAVVQALSPELCVMLDREPSTAWSIAHGMNERLQASDDPDAPNPTPHTGKAARPAPP